MAIWTQGGFFQELAEREQHLQWFPKAYVPAVKKDDGFVVTVTGCSCGKCGETCKPPAPKEPPPPKKEEPKCVAHHCHCCRPCC